jgi:hypothetical protein
VGGLEQERRVFWVYARKRICIRPEDNLDLVKQTGLPVLVAAIGGKSSRPARITTPFILERANPPQDGGAKPWAHPSPFPSSRAGRSPGGKVGRQVAEGMGR